MNAIKTLGAFTYALKISKMEEENIEDMQLSNKSLSWLFEELKIFKLTKSVHTMNFTLSLCF